MLRRGTEVVQCATSAHGDGGGARGPDMRRGTTMRLAYTVALYCAAPFLVGRLLWRGLRNPGYRRRIGERFGMGARIGAQRGCVWIHAVSVGEVQAAVPIVKALGSRYPDETIVVTSTTPTGAARAAKAFGGSVVHRYFPVRPSRLGGEVHEPHPAPRSDHHGDRDLAEPAGRSAVFAGYPWCLPTCVCRSAPRPDTGNSAASSRLRSTVLRRLRSRVTRMRTGMASIGAPPDVIEVTGSTKFDIPMLASLREEAAALRRTWGPSRGIWIAASTHEGEEALVLDAFEHVLERIPGSLLVLVPRHPERFGKVAAQVRRRGFESVLRSHRPPDCSGAQVFIGDTMGELPLFYTAADVAFVGGTLVERGGHNVLEPAALGVPVLFGPHVFNFAAISRRLLEAGGARAVSDSADLGRAVTDYLQDADLRNTTGARGRAFVEGNRGAGERVLAIVGPYLGPARDSSAAQAPGPAT